MKDNAMFKDYGILFTDYDGYVTLLKFAVGYSPEDTISLNLSDGDVLSIKLMAYTDTPFYVITTRYLHDVKLYDDDDGHIICDNGDELYCWLLSFLYERNLHIVDIYP